MTGARLFSQQMVVVPAAIEQRTFDQRIEHIEYGLVSTAWQQGYVLHEPVWDFWVERDEWFADAWMAHIHVRALGIPRKEVTA